MVKQEEMATSKNILYAVYIYYFIIIIVAFIYVVIIYTYVCIELHSLESPDLISILIG